jgi:hypothetical protein
MATATFKQRFRSQVRDLVVLVRVSLRHPTTLAVTNVYLSTATVLTPAGTVTGEPSRMWVPLIADAGSISAPGAFAQTDVGLCSTSLVVARAAFDPTLLLDNAPVTVWLWDRSFTDFDDACAVFSNGRVLAFDDNADTVTLRVRQRTDWNRDLVPVEVTPEAYPQAPEESIGQRVPIVYGKALDVPFRQPWAAYPGVTNLTGGGAGKAVYYLLGGRRVGPAILVDTGRGAGAAANPKARVLVASHKCATVADVPFFNTPVYMKLGEQMCMLEPVDALNDIFKTTTGSGLLIPDNVALAWTSALPVDVDVVANSGENPRAVLDPFNDDWTRLDWTNNLKTVRMKMPSLDEKLGEMAEYYIFCGYRSNANTNLKLRLRNTATGGTFDMDLAASATRVIKMLRVGTAWGSPGPVAPWGFSECELEAGWPTSTPVITGTGTAEIFFAGVVVRFRPRQVLIQSERGISRTEHRPVQRTGPGGGPGERPAWAPYTVNDLQPAVEELAGTFYANSEGYADDGTFAPIGSFTGGGATTVVERGPDIIAHMLVAHGGEALANIERTAAAFGSFVDARALLKTVFEQDMVYALAVVQTTDVMTALAWMSQATMSLLILDRFSDQWRLIPWSPDAGVNYDWTFRPEDLVEGTSVQTSRTPVNRLLTGLSLSYGYDAASKSFRHKTRLAWNGSNAGDKYRGLRDQYLTIVAGVNDKLDFTTTAAFTATVAPGDYDAATAGPAVATAMKNANPAQDFAVEFGGVIVAGYNDQITFRDSVAGVDRTATIPAGTYATMQALGTAIKEAMDALCAPNTPFTVVYVPSTALFAFSRFSESGHIALSVTLYPATSGVVSRRLYAMLGYSLAANPPASTSPIVSTETRRIGLAVVACLGNALDLRWQSGANGVTGTRQNVGSFLGFTAVRDTESGGTVRAWSGDCPKGTGERALNTTALRFGARRDTVEDLRTVFDSETAREVLRRVTTLLGRVRVIVTFSTDKAPDLERGRVIQFSGDFDAVRPYPDADTDRSWVGKRFVVVETEQMLGPVAFYTKVKAVALG